MDIKIIVIAILAFFNVFLLAGVIGNHYATEDGRKIVSQNRGSIDSLEMILYARLKNLSKHELVSYLKKLEDKDHQLIVEENRVFLGNLVFVFSDGTLSEVR